MEILVVQNKFVSYIGKGMVYGNLWGGGEGGYPSKEIRSETYTDLIKQIKEGIDDGSLDGGMGFESLIGVGIEICKIETLIVNDKPYIHKEYSFQFVGDLNETQKEFLTEIYEEGVYV